LASGTVLLGCRTGLPEVKGGRIIKTVSQDKYTILYARLSQEDLQKKSGVIDDSNSIQNQRLLLEKYAEEKGFQNVKFIYDDGYSGTSFRRPGWAEITDLIEADQVATIIVKDMSRLGREYLQVGQYVELVFPSHGIRFIAVNDGVDSLCEPTNDFTPFRNIMNEFYAKDCSKKVRSAMRVKAESGAHMGSIPAYGYMKDPEDPKRHIVPDPETAPIVRRIFALCAAGNGPSQIARVLAAESIMTPTYYYYTKYGVELTGLNLEYPYRWSTTTLAGILENEVYLGTNVSMRKTTVSYKNRKLIQRPESEHVRFENAHEAIIDQQTWDIVQDVRSHKKRPTKMDQQDMFSGLVFCMDCGSTMGLTRSHNMPESQYCFTCRNHKENGKNVCSSHYIRESVLAAVVLDDIRRITHFARQNEVLFAQHIGMKRSREAKQEIASLQKRIDTMTRRESELAALFKRLYEDNVLHRIPDEQYRILSEEYITELNSLQEELPKLQEHQKELKNSISNVSSFLDKAKQYETLDELTPEILRIFVKRIEIGERETRYSRHARQDIKIYYRDIGDIDLVPQSMEDAETLAHQEQGIA
jgi:DNA invertase Pin-like site-specific DNA recombinase